MTKVTFDWIITAGCTGDVHFVVESVDGLQLRTDDVVVQPHRARSLLRLQSPSHENYVEVYYGIDLLD